MTAEAFAVAEGLNVATLRHWAWKLGREARPSSVPIELVPVEIHAAAVAEAIEIVAGALIVRLPRGADVAYVGALVRELQSSC